MRNAVLKSLAVPPLQSRPPHLGFAWTEARLCGFIVYAGVRLSACDKAQGQLEWSLQLNCEPSMLSLHRMGMRLIGNAKGACY